MLVIPLLWSVIGLWAAISLGMDEDLGLVIAGFSGVFIVQRHAQSKKCYARKIGAIECISRLFRTMVLPRPCLLLRLWARINTVSLTARILVPRVNPECRSLQ